MVFRSNGYSGTTRGVILRVADAPETPLSFEIHDEHLERQVLDETFEIPLSEPHVRIRRLLDLGGPDPHRLFSREPHHPELTLDVDWIDPRWPRVVQTEWEDTGQAGDWYFVRIEQLDGNIAWSSPVWFQ